MIATTKTTITKRIACLTYEKHTSINYTCKYALKSLQLYPKNLSSLQRGIEVSMYHC